MLDFETDEEITVDFFRQLRKLLHVERPRCLRINHSTITRISPEAAIVLIAEIVRCQKENPRCKMRGSSAKTPEVHDMLGRIGYWDYFKGIHAEPNGATSRHFLKHQNGNRTTGAVAKSLIELFVPEAQWTDAEKKTLYPAIIECMDNVMKHAYPASQVGEFVHHRWWLLGYRDSTNHEVSFCFYDQGLGIPRTIRTRWKDKLGFISPSDSDLIVKAVVEGYYSSTRDPTRGRGLPALKRFIDKSAGGRLMIVSRLSRCIFNKVDSKTTDLKKKFEGTLISWTLRGS